MAQRARIVEARLLGLGPRRLKLVFVQAGARPQLPSGTLPRDWQAVNLALAVARGQDAGAARRVVQVLVLDVEEQAGAPTGLARVPLVAEHDRLVEVRRHVVEHRPLVPLVVEVHVDVILFLEQRVQLLQQRAVVVVVTIDHQAVQHQHGDFDALGFEMIAHGLQEDVLGVAEHEVEEGAFFVGLAPIGLAMPELESLDVIECELTDAALTGQLAPALCKVRKLFAVYFDGNPITDDGLMQSLEESSGFLTLHVLSLAHCEQLTTTRCTRACCSRTSCPR